ncbi:hypothetical protein BO79DRAFT_253204 [Aspergillus costaricaensis CBS 115574]|uniref:Uncharacterized protein n=1 Tax=Aspergillus costaricaensis CBS 115574 TaxID=1448317 RepID=A0ACD1IJD2_9EURO|nr:hypothetical protein BO79DRAFT_253204 [Aspergillus costaricaensis CBS 115574]RAK90420.1 hypothetical protein BO79DRAFT_253204 [Aspergillus costaricaensis CBS 115574]
MAEKHETPGAIHDIKAENGLPPRYFCSSFFALPAPLLAIINQNIGPSADIS